MSSTENLHDADGKPLENAENKEVNENANPQEEPPKPQKVEKDVVEDTTDYANFSAEECVAALKDLLKVQPIVDARQRVNALKKHFEALSKQKEKEAFEAYNSEEDAAPEDFKFEFPHRDEFYALLKEYRKRKSEEQKQRQKELEDNLLRREAIIEEIKTLISQEENLSSTFKRFRELQDAWRALGPIPHDTYNRVWNDYRHHVTNFYDYLDLNKELRDLDFTHNLEQKRKLIERAKALKDLDDVHLALREIQELHRIWKEEVGPVEKELRDELWEEFSEATKVVHQKRQDYYNALQIGLIQNGHRKVDVINQIKTLANPEEARHKEWQRRIKQVEELRQQFFSIGRAPKEVNDQIWDMFKEACKNFNHQKNEFYKSIKQRQLQNLEKKQALLDIANEHKEKPINEESTRIIKKIQAEWKEVGHVPRSKSDKIWEAFKAACNTYFDRLKQQKSKDEEFLVKNLETKKTLLEQLQAYEVAPDKQESLKQLQQFIQSWQSAGRVPFNAKKIDQEFDKCLKEKLQKAGFDAAESEHLRYKLRITNLLENEDFRKLRDEASYLTKKIEELKAERIQVDNNMQFLNTKDDKNPLLKSVQSKIGQFDKKIATLEGQLRTLRKTEKEFSEKPEKDEEEE
ncbi:MAG: DUF349 domain-containing protein [Flavobacteriaceae bacterium]|nr:DUF349 domain-containing protein [Flavobacteriaceae bacterium]